MQSAVCKFSIAPNNPVNPCSGANPSALDYSNLNSQGQTAQQHILQNHTGSGKGPSIYQGDWFSIQTLNGSTLMYGYPAPANRQSPGSVTLQWDAQSMVPFPLNLVPWYIGTDQNGNPTSTNRLVVLSNCKTVVTSYPVAP